VKPKRPLLFASAILLASAIALWIASAFGAGGRSASQRLALVPAAPAARPASPPRPDMSLLLREQHAIARSRLTARRARRATAAVKSRHREHATQRSARIPQRRPARARRRRHRALLLAPSRGSRTALHRIRRVRRERTRAEGEQQRRARPEHRAERVPTPGS
jgi:hypothetical protein